MGASSRVAVAVFASYFIIIIVTFWILLRSILQSYILQRLSSHRKRAALFIFLATSAFAHTWYYMFRFMEWSFKDYESKGETRDFLMERINNWLVHTALFEQAWYTVCSTYFRWWLSEQLCSYTVGAWTLFVFVEGRRRQISHVWLYMLLGQLVAISVASNLFYAALSLSTARSVKKVTFVSPVLWLSILLSLCTVAYTPFTDERTFLPNLVTMHILAVLPLLCGSYLDTPTPGRFSLKFRTLHLLVFLMTISIHIRNSRVLSLEIQKPFLDGLWDTLFSHPAQSSIGFDVIWTSVSFMVWAMFSNTAPIGRRIPLSLLTPLVSVGVVAPLLAFLDDCDEEHSLRANRRH
ncbi:hypothetical protein BDP27DRAFT_1221589 [Rhodocollybia butyracea]|uniref:Uncharacterized protein n=1 Tax=Rhodocollybia butyracea TaxID=206335 RepID=A0A9P5PXL3_9AGAR|nr:hypothetical protein BDP27DRAFT_1221589 [Rhodocollybia butyracea]